MATSKLQRKFGDMLDRNFPQYRIRENYRPNWLISSDHTWLELDFYIEDLKLAFEVQGDQHFIFIPFFHKTDDDFRKRKRHDQEKRDLCFGRNIKLTEICTNADALAAIEDIKAQLGTLHRDTIYTGMSLAQMNALFLVREAVKNPNKQTIPRANKHVANLLKKHNDDIHQEIMQWYFSNKSDIDKRAGVA